MFVERFKKWFFKRFVVKRMYDVKRFIHSKKLFTFDKVERKVTALAGQVYAEDVIAQMYSTFIVKYKWWELIIEWLRHNLAVYVSDPTYYTVSSDVFRNVKPTNIYKYSVDVFDCDDFSFLKKGFFEEYGYVCEKNYAFGIVWVYSSVKGVGHALNFFVDDSGVLRFYEPQTDSPIDLSDDWKLIVAFI